MARVENIPPNPAPLAGGTGTGAASVIAQVARECGALTVGVVTKPFTFEGRRRSRFAHEGIEKLESAVDTLITIPNDRLLQVTSANTSLMDAFGVADEVLLHATQGVSDLITVSGIINVDFADVRTIMSNQGRALMGMGIGSDEGRAVQAAQQAINSPLLEDVTIQGAKGILINITAGSDLRLHEIDEAASLVHEAAHEDCNIIFGAVVDPNMGDSLRITVIATGFDQRDVAEEEVEAAVKTQGSLRRSGSLPMNPMLAAASRRGGTQPHPAPEPVLGRRPRQPQPQPQPEPRAAQTGLFTGGHPAQSQQGQQPQQGPAASGSWVRGEQPQDRDVPAFLRRQRDDGYVR